MNALKKLSYVFALSTILASCRTNKFVTPTLEVPEINHDIQCGRCDGDNRSPEVSDYYFSENRPFTFLADYKSENVSLDGAYSREGFKGKDPHRTTGKIFVGFDQQGSLEEFRIIDFSGEADENGAYETYITHYKVQYNDEQGIYEGAPFYSHMHWTIDTFDDYGDSCRPYYHERYGYGRSRRYRDLSSDQKFNNALKAIQEKIKLSPSLKSQNLPSPKIH